MTTIVTRAGKGSALSYTEMDANFTNLNNDKAETSALSAYETSVHAATTYATQTTVATNASNAMQKASNLSDVANVVTARTNLGVSATGADTTYNVKSANLSDVANVNTARTNLGLGTAATKDTGTSAGQVVVLDGSAKLPAVDGSQLTNLPSTSIGQHMVRLYNPNGFGSTNTVIRRFLTTVTNTGSSITYTDSATNGASFTINTSGVYAISYGDNFVTTNAWMGLSLNSTQLTTQINGITGSDILAVTNTISGNLAGHVSWTGYLASGSVIRPHCQEGLSNGSGSNPVFTIVRVV